MKRLSMLLRSLPSRDLGTLAALCAGAGVLTMAALVMGTPPLASAVPQPAATVLGDAQGVPPSYTGHPYPDYTTCYFNLSSGYTSPNNPVCLGNDDTSIYTGIFSISVANSTTGQSAYLVSNWGKVPSCSNPGRLGCFGIQSTATHLAGEALQVPPGTPLTLQWSCLPRRTVNFEEKTGTNPLSSGSWSVSTDYSIVLATSVTGSGSGFAFTGGAVRGTMNINAPIVAGTYVYKVDCVGSTYNLSPMSITITAKDPCTPVNIINNSFKLASGALARIQTTTTDGKSYNFCVFNPTVFSYFVPVKLAAEVVSFSRAVQAGNLIDSKGNSVTLEPY